jgi:hypothetical protein
MLLRPKHLRAIDLLAHTDLPRYQVARKLRISRHTLRQWLAAPEFSEELKSRQSVSADSVEGLRLRAARSSLARIAARLQSGVGDMPIHHLTRLLGELSSERFGVLLRMEEDFAKPPYDPRDEEESDAAIAQDLDPAAGG